MKKVILGLFVLISSSTLFSQNGNIREFIIADAKIACFFDNSVTSCLRIKTHPDSTWRDFPYTIEGFIFEPGVEATVVVEETPILFPEGNGPKYTYKLIKVVSSRNTVLDNRLLLANNKWKIINLEMERVITPSKKANAYIVFNIDSNSLSGFGGCNHFGGNSLIENGVIQFGILSSTLMSCANDDIERKIMEGLKGKAAFYIRNNILFVVCENHLIIHMRPEKRLDSMINAINKPVETYKGNTIADMQNGQYIITLDDMKEAGGKQMVFTGEKLSTNDKKTLRLKIKNLSAEDPVQEIRILLKPHKMKGFYYAQVILKDGTKKSVILRNVL